MITIGTELEALIQKLQHTCDSRTQSRVFIGTVQLEWTDEGAILRPEEFVWDTKDSGDSINTRTIRGPDGLHARLSTHDPVRTIGAGASSLFDDEDELGQAA